MKNKVLDVTLVIPTRDRFEALSKCLMAISKQTFIDFKIVIVDDASICEAPLYTNPLRIDYYKLTKNKKQAFCKNFGAKKSKGIIVFIDDDCIPSKTWLNNLLLPFALDSRIAVVGGYVENLAPNWDRYSSIFRLFSLLDPCFIRGYKTGKILRSGEVSAHFKKDRTISYVDWVTAGNMAVKKEIFLKVRGFDTNLIGDCSYEEPDLCYRIKELGYKIVYAPKAIVKHDYHPVRDFKKKLFFVSRNQTYFLLKNALYKKSFVIVVFCQFWQIFWCLLLSIFDAVQINRLHGKIDGLKFFLTNKKRTVRQFERS